VQGYLRPQHSRACFDRLCKLVRCLAEGERNGQRAGGWQQFHHLLLDQLGH
jgi:hypothetical protein